MGGYILPFVETNRLKLVTFTVQMMEALSISKSELEKIVPYNIAEGYPMEVYRQFFAYKIERFQRFPDENEWEGIIINKKDNTIIGDMGFKGGPNEEGIIDIGYSIVPNYQGKGYATEMGKAMVEWGLSQPNVKKIVATCNPDNLSSQRVLNKIGFSLTNTTDKKLYWSY